MEKLPFRLCLVLLVSLVWGSANRADAAPLPLTGPIAPELQPLADAMTQFMTPRSFSPGTLAVMKDDRMVLRLGVGWQNKESTVPIHPDALMRLASISKPITGSAVTKLVNTGRLSYNTKVYDLLGLTPFGGTLGDSRITNITVQHLLDHTGGWDRNVGPVFDPVFKTIQISQEMGLNHPATPTEVIQWMFSKPLQYAPGTTSSYSNFGYDLLGRVIEKVTGMSYIDYVRGTIFVPFGITNIIQSRSRPAERDPREIWYADSSFQRSAVDYPTNISVSFVDGAGYYESYDAFGGWSSSAIDLCRYMQSYLVSNQARPANSTLNWNYVFYGSLPGTTTAIHQDLRQTTTTTNALEFAVLFNQRTEGSSVDENDLIHNMVVNAANGISSWPTASGGQLEWGVTTTNHFKSAGSVTVPILRTGGSAGTVKVSYTTYSQTAGSSDYTPQQGILIFAPGEVQKNVTIPLSDNGLTEPKKQFTLELVSASGGASLGGKFTSTIGILSRPQLRASAPPVAGQFTFTLSGAEGAKVSIDGSADLNFWKPLDTVTNLSSTLTWSDKGAGTNKTQFYRAVTIP